MKYLGGGDRPRKTLDFSAFRGVCPQNLSPKKFLIVVRLQCVLSIDLL